MFVPNIEGYIDHTGDWNPVDLEYGDWIEGGEPARYSIGPEDSVWIMFDDDGVAWEYMDDEW